VKATIVGSTITCYINNTAIFRVNDTTYPSGNPGMGFYLQNGSGPPSNYGFSSYTASDGTQTPTPTPSPDPTATPSPVPVCMVPNFIGVRMTRAQSVWQAAGFIPPSSITMRGPNGRRITWQSLPAGSFGACADTAIVVQTL
jgi:hypothetical protein